MTITMHRAVRLVEARETLHRQRQQCRTFKFLEDFADLLLRRPVNPRVRDRLLPIQQVRILLFQTDEALPLQPIVLHIFDARLHLPLVVRTIRLRRQDHRAVMHRERLQLRMQLRVVPVRLRHRRFQVVDDDRLGNAPEVAERILQRSHERFRRLP